MRMNPEIKARWVAALRSGEYAQGAGELRSYNDKFCCLGVLCDIRDNNEWMSACESQNAPYGYKSSDCFDYPPQLIADWAQLDWHVQVEINGNVDSLAEHNDSGRTFAEIADAIEQQL